MEAGDGKDEQWKEGKEEMPQSLTTIQKKQMPERERQRLSRGV